MRALHDRLLEAYRSLATAGWHTGPNDGYFFFHLIHHLIEAGRGEEVHDVLAANTPEGRNAWYEAKEAIGDGAGYRRDVARAWQLAETGGRQASLWPSIGLECRYTLVTASLNSVGGSIPPPMLAALARIGRALSMSTTFPAALRERRQAFEAALSIAVEPFAENGMLSEEVVAKAVVFCRDGPRGGRLSS
jgi:hypothetical protein